LNAALIYYNPTTANLNSIVAKISAIGNLA